jgi:uncharacterized protein (TIGR00369 family)
LITARESAARFARSAPEATRERALVWQDPAETAARGLRLSGIEYAKSLLSGEMPSPPMGVVMDFRPVEADEGRCVFEGTPGGEHANPTGVIHGGYAATMLDSVMWFAVFTTLPAGTTCTSLGIEAKYVRPITLETGAVRCEGGIVYRGRKQATAEARLTAIDSGKLLATGTATCMIIE